LNDVQKRLFQLVDQAADVLDGIPTSPAILRSAMGARLIPDPTDNLILRSIIDHANRFPRQESIAHRQHKRLWHPRSPSCALRRGHQPAVSIGYQSDGLVEITSCVMLREAMMLSNDLTRSELFRACRSCREIPVFQRLQRFHRIEHSGNSDFLHRLIRRCANQLLRT
jgi:hypothetical protein